MNTRSLLVDFRTKVLKSEPENLNGTTEAGIY